MSNVCCAYLKKKKLGKMKGRVRKSSCSCSCKCFAYKRDRNGHKKNLSLYEENDIRTFSKVRDAYFIGLKRTISENLKKKSLLNLEPCEMETVSLQLEQQAILASLQTEIYVSVMGRIIQSIKDSTIEDRLHPKVVYLISKICPHYFSGIVRRDCPEENTISVNGKVDVLVSKSENKTPVIDKLPLPIEEEVQVELPKCVSLPSTEVTDDEIYEVPVIVKQEKELDCVKSTEIEQKKEETEIEQKKEETEDDNLFIEALVHFLEEKADAPVNLESRIDEMRDFFHKTEAAATIVKQPSSKPLETKMWRYERFIFMYKVVTSTKRMTSRRYFETINKFKNLFGEDSDDAHEDDYVDHDVFIDNCVHRILPKVAKFVLPYYKAKRVCGGSLIFKSLVRRIAESVVDTNFYPSSKDIEKVVTKFFPERKMYVNVNDVWMFVPSYDE